MVKDLTNFEGLKTKFYNLARFYNTKTSDEDFIDHESIYSENEISIQSDSIHRARWAFGDGVLQFLTFFQNGAIEFRSLENSCSIRLEANGVLVRIKFMRELKKSEVKLK